jgi:cobalt-zinc-cadmium efflux system outer membrane protein
MHLRIPLALLYLAASVAALSQDRATVSKDLASRTGHGVMPEAPVANVQVPSFPPGISFTGKLSDEDAVAIALWNNAGLEAVLANLGLARADLVEAGLLRNPNLNLLFPVGPKPFEFALQWPVELFWQRPRRVAAADLNLRQVSTALVQNGLDLARDVRVAWAGLELAEKKAAIARESADLRAKIADLTARRFEVGDISALDLVASKADARASAQQAAQLERDVDIAAERLRELLGLRREERKLSSVPAPIADSALPEWQALLEAATETRPDLRAAEIGIHAAAARAHWERSRVLALVAPILSIKEVGTSGVRSGPGASIDLPVFHRNQGSISRADADVERATRNYLALRDRIELEVRESRLLLVQARESLRRLRTEILPAFQEAIGLAEKSYGNGDSPYLGVLEANRQIFDSRVREAEASAAVRRATAELERSIGRKL